MEVLIENDVMAPMRDGTRLACDIYRPAGSGKRPTLLMRIPYGRARTNWGTLLFDADDALARGYAVVVQDCRGTTGSEGVFAPIVQERDDGHDAIRWVADQSWCDGAIGMWGGSYMGLTALQAAVDGPPQLKAVIAYVTGGDYQENWGRTGGVLEFGFNLRWSLDQAAAQLTRPSHGLSPEQVQAIRAEVEGFWRSPREFLARSLDVRAVAPVSAKVVGLLERFADADEDDPFWASVSPLAGAARISAPVLSIAGLQDGMETSMIALHNALVEGGDPRWRKDHRLVIGPWDHQSYLSVVTAMTSGARTFGRDAMGGRVGLRGMALDWFDTWLKGADPGAATAAPVRYYMQGLNRWETAQRWPPRTQARRWRLSSGGRANTRSGDGVLTLAAAGAEPPDSYAYDPRDPAPTVGGRGLLYPHTPGGIQEQSRLEDRADVLVYTSAILTQAVEVRGRVTLELHVSTSAPTTDFVATLVDVDPAGDAWGVADGIQRIRRDGVAEETMRVTVDLGDAAYRFEAGHRIRAHVTSSSFPRFERNRNVGRDAAPDAFQVAYQQVFHDAERPSALILPVTPTS